MALLERDWVLDSLRDLAANAASGSGSMVFNAGEAGAGKTSVIRAFLDELPDSHAVLMGACDSMPSPGQLWPLRASWGTAVPHRRPL
jgi:predicted ATPase